MNYAESWEKFRETGHISDYLSYIACTKDEFGSEFSISKEGGNGGELCHSDGDGFNCHAYR